MSDDLDVQLFRDNGTWIKPARAATVDVILAGGDASSLRWLSAAEIELDAGKGSLRADSGAGAITARTFDAGDVGAEVAVVVGRAGRTGVGTGATGGLGYGGGGASSLRPSHDGFAVIITHLAP